jgi:predicted Zn-dependent protease
MLALFQKSRRSHRVAAAPDPTRTALERALLRQDRAQARTLLAELQEREPAEPRWPHKLAEVLAAAGLRPEAARAYRHAATLYAKRGFEARAFAMTRLARSLTDKSVPLQASHPSLIPDPSSEAQLCVTFTGK